jgi:hypothetical protein
MDRAQSGPAARARARVAQWRRSRQSLRRRVPAAPRKSDWVGTHVSARVYTMRRAAAALGENDVISPVTTCPVAASGVADGSSFVPAVGQFGATVRGSGPRSALPAGYPRPLQRRLAAFRVYRVVNAGRWPGRRGSPPRAGQVRAGNDTIACGPSGMPVPVGRSEVMPPAGDGVSRPLPIR